MATKVALPPSVEEIPGLLNPQACRDWLFRQLHPTGPACPSCNRTIEDSRAVRRFFAGRIISCDACDTRFGPITGTIFSGTQMFAEDLAAMLVLFGMGQRDADIASALDLHRATVSRWRRTLNEHGAAL
ncbi:conserved hypothetical protein [Solidesulfovibrio fructosivorans JJ]]|uniref:Transposase zinc-ribbon domain-containing protein n=1 Tax=Solidesulfovibrio fructosivorans JJ] TaxID=596151 RepID=E1JXF4_SOLFR|nr:helix-turn-helix domain-containing protein [Solidesulfovibrio fructosivorans]EFL50931.1 conserved hypothetical protein [Solidesulfovibrio fructosivorans JJ]]